MEYNYLVTPLVTVAGIPDPPASRSHKESNPLYGAHQIERITVCEADVTPSRPVAQVASRLAELSVDPPQWDPRLLKWDRVRFQFSNHADVPLKSVKPSVLSPRHGGSTAPIFTPQWIDKYMCVQPAAIIAFCDTTPVGSEAEDDLIAALNGLVDELKKSGGTQLMAVVTGPPDDLARVLPLLRRETDLSRPNQLLALADDLSDEDVIEFTELLFKAVTTLVDGFFAQKLHSVREKRKQVAPPLDLMVWDARYTLKLAFFSEFRGDVAGAMRLYESVYDSLSLLFENKAITVASPAYMNARQCLDLIALKIFQHSLPLKMAHSKLVLHIDTIRQLLVKNNLDPDSSVALNWQAIQYAVFAHLSATFARLPEAASNVILQQPGGTPTGLVWLDAASLFARSEYVKSTEGSENAQDPYDGCQHSPEFTPQHCFLNAISDLTEYRRSKAFALKQYGDWLSFWAEKGDDNDQSAAAEAYKSASRLLAPNTWPQSQLYLGAKLNDKISMFTLGETTEFPAEATTSDAKISTEDDETPKPAKSLHSPTVNDNLFIVTGNWRSRETHIGREIQAQVTMTPKLARRFKLDKIVIGTSLGFIEVVHDEARENQKIVMASMEQSTAARLYIDSHPKIFQFGITPVKTGKATIDHVTIFIGDFTQRLDVKRTTNQWISYANETQQELKVRHLPLDLDPRSAQITTRPAKLKLSDLTSPVAALSEQFKFVFDLTSDEEEKVAASVCVSLVTIADERPTPVYEKKLELIPATVDSSSPAHIEGTFTAPNALFELKVLVNFNTSQDTLPVSFEYTKEIDVARPFRVTFDVVPEHYEHDWPAVFAPVQDIPVIPRKWRLTLTSLTTFKSESLILRSTELDLKSPTAKFELCKDDESGAPVDLEMPYNSVKRLSHSFLAESKEATVAQPLRNFEAAANIQLKWSRKSSPEIINTLVLPSVRLNLPTQEPRVLVVCDKAGGSSEITQVTYHVENATAKLLNFSVQMSSSTYFAYQGPRVAHVKMLPFSTRKLTYQLVPLGDGSVQNRRPLPDLRVFDVNYKRILPIAPGDKLISFDQGTLFI